MRRKVAEDARAFEEEMERDAFLYEAIEGFEDMHVSDVQQALDELDDRLDRKSRRRLVLPWKMVAGIAAIIAVGAATISVLPSGDKDVAVEPEVEVEVEVEESSDKPGYSPRYVQPTFGVLDAPMEETVIAATDSVPMEELMKDEVIAFEEVSEPDPTPALESQRESASNESPILAVEELKEKDTERDELKSLTSDFSVEDDISATESELNGEELDIAAVEQKVSNQSIQPLNAVEVSAIKTSARQKQEKNNQPSVPSIGMPAYKQYLKSSVRKKDDMPRGSVTVSFEFDKDGNPRKVRVENSLCESCDAEAIRLIESGAAWTVGDRKQRVTMEVTFQ